MVRTALCVAYGALMRTGAGQPLREDYPKRDDKNWLKRTLAYWKGADLPLDYEDVACPILPPGDRGTVKQVRDRKKANNTV